jgi:bifunctional NMN adenylyltransferase/nudix hydrolase
MNDARYAFGVVIGRFQPFHNGHLELINAAFAQCDRVIVVLGSARSARTTKNPWRAEEREEMIRASLRSEQLERLHLVHVRDYFNNDNLWISDVQGRVGEIVDDPEEEICLFGCAKDENTSAYLRSFPQWQEEQLLQSIRPIDATEIRRRYFEETDDWAELVPEPVADALRTFARGSHFDPLVEEHRYLQDYRRRWESAPFMPTFVTTDVVVVKSGHVLAVRRRAQPGKGSLALPGGFVKPNETLLRGAIRELKEETKITMKASELRERVVDTKVFDYPFRSLRGRTITHAYLIDLGTGDLPVVKGSDDAERALWLPFFEAIAREQEWFEDHIHIVMHFLQSGHRVA